MQRAYHTLAIHIDGQVYHYTSGGRETLQNDTYQDGLVVNTVTVDELRFTVPNHKKQASSLLLNHTVRACRIVLTLHRDKEATRIFDGVGNALTRLTANEAQIHAINHFGLSKIPNKAIAPPLFNHLMASASAIHFAGQQITFKS